MTVKRVFVNGRFYTFDSHLPNTEAVATENGSITEIGGSSTLRSLGRKGFELVDLEGRTVIPGLIDSHLHLLGLGRSFRRVNLDGVASLAEVKRILANAAAKLANGKWLLGRGWNKNLWGDEFPDKNILDQIYDGPTALNSKDGHLLWVNSAALKYCGIDSATPDPPGGVIVKDKNGAPSGILMENASDIVFSRIPQESFDDKLKSVKAAQEYLLNLGIIGAGDCDEDGDLFPIYEELDKSGALLLRLFKMIPRDNFQQAIDLKYHTGSGSEHFRFGCLKLFADGALGSQTAYMFNPYEKSLSNHGVETLTLSEIEDYVKRAVDANIAVAIHAIGDKANYQALCGVGNFADAFRKKNLRPRIEHAQLLRQSDIALFSRHNIIASMQPIHATSDRDIADRYWGGRSRYAYPFKTLLDDGARLAFGSDAPIETANPLAGIHAAVTRRRKNEDRPPWYPDERITVRQAVEAYSIGAAHACCYDDLTGSITVGKRADFVVLPENIFEMPPDGIADVSPLMTVIDGQIAFQKD
jgi:hypothetical protein